MCTALTFTDGELYFGRTLDHTETYGESVIVMPRRFPLPFRQREPLLEHHAIVGIGCVQAGYPLYYDGINEKGLAMAGLNFTQSACYSPVAPDRDNVAQFELLPWILSQCADLEQARQLLARTNVIDLGFSRDLPPARLHWLLADRRESMVVEIMADGIHLHRDPAGILTNEPPFPFQRFRLREWMGLSTGMPENHFDPALPLRPYSRGMGALGLPGDLSSASRFVRAAFFRANTRSAPTDNGPVNRFFQILDTVRMPLGSCQTETGHPEYTLYTSCYNADRGICYYTTDQNRQITAVDLHREALDGQTLTRYPLQNAPAFEWEN